MCASLMQQSAKPQDASPILTLYQNLLDVCDEIDALKQLIAVYEQISLEQTRALEEQLFGYTEQQNREPSAECCQEGPEYALPRVYLIEGCASSENSSEGPSELEEQVELLEAILQDRKALLKALNERRVPALTEYRGKALTSLL